MAKDILGNKLVVGKKIFLNGVIYTIKEVNENRILGGKAMTQNRGVAIKIPDTLVLEADFPFDTDKPVNGFMVLEPPETIAPEA
jgi:tartrate dehydratase beta subunit/fumarate hydratase class I family protein